jgi:transmembrane sensor
VTVQETRKPSAEARAAAAAWVARLHGPNRTREVEAGFRRWLADDAEHAAAFELLTDTWEKSARLRRRPAETVARGEPLGFRISFSRAVLATVAAALLAIAATVFYLHSDAVTTGVGELRTLVLDDGTRLYLNASTRVRVHYDKQFRRVSLEEGEALFEVAKRPDWPFIVTAGGREIRALGTSFVVRSDEEDLVVTLVEGKVTVTPEQEKKQRQSQQKESFVLSPGQRLTFASAGSPKIDRPSLERVTAWKLGQVNLDNTPLADAVAEMNRYSRQRIVIEDPVVAAIPVSGIFIAGDSANFAQAVAKAYHLKVIEENPDVIVLSSARE